MLAEAEAYKELVALYLPSVSAEGGGSVPPLVPGGETAAGNAGREIFDRCLQKVQDTFRADKRILRDVLDDCKLKVAHDSTIEWLKVILLRLCKTYGRDAIPVVDREILDKELEAASAAVAAQNGDSKKEEKEKSPSPDVAANIEEGEEIDDTPFMPCPLLSSSLHSATQLRKLVLERGANLVCSNLNCTNNIMVTPSIFLKGRSLQGDESESTCRI